MQKKTTPADQLVGQRIMVLRKAKGLSQAALGTAIGVSFRQLQKYERGTNRVGAGRLSDIARLLEVPVATFFDDGEGGDPQRQNEMLGLLAPSGAMELLRLYASIDNDDVRNDVRAIVCRAASAIALGRSDSDVASSATA